MAGANRRRRYPNSKGALMQRAQIILLGIVVLASSACALAQTTVTADNIEALPSAPTPQAIPNQSGVMPGQSQAMPTPQTAPVGAPLLTLKDAEALAIKNNPQISVVHLLALASQQVAREVRSNLWPTANGNITGVDAQSGTRITAGFLNNPSIYERAAAGVMVTQLITDFGRT